MSVTLDMTATLRAQEHGHQPIVCLEAGGVLAMNEREMSMMISENVANTLTATDYKGCQIICMTRKTD